MTSSKDLQELHNEESLNINAAQEPQVMLKAKYASPILIRLDVGSTEGGKPAPTSPESGTIGGS